MISAYDYCYDWENFNDISGQLTDETNQDLELIKYFVYDHYTEYKYGYSHYYDLTFAELYDDVDALLNKYNFKGNVIRNSFLDNFENWNEFKKEVNELFDVFLIKNNIILKRINHVDND